MALLRNQPLARKALLIGLAPAVCAILVVGIASNVATFIRARTNTFDDLGAQAAMVAANVSTALESRDQPSANATLALFSARPNVEAVCVYDARGALFASYETPRSACPASADVPLRSSLGRLRVESAVTTDTMSLGSVRIIGDLILFYGWMRWQAAALLASLFVGTGLAFTLTWRLQRSFTEPVLTLARTADDVSRRRDYSLRATRTTADEIGGLVDSFNSMLEEIERRDQALLTEISERRRAEALKDAFLAAVSHELRTPLNAILGWLQLIRNAKPGAATLERALSTIERNARSQARLIEDLLDVSRMTAGKFEIAREATDLRHVLASAVEMVMPSAAHKRIQLTVSEANGPCPVHGDSERLQQMVLNILSNAVKFTPAGGRVDVGLSADDTHLSLRVQDTGVGIAPEFLPRVFEPFLQADSSMSRQYGGLGLGLAIAREVALQHGGTIVAASDGPGRGAVFTVTLPRTVAAADAAAGPDAPRREWTQSLVARHILVVDDDQDGLDVACATLAAAGARTTSVRTGIDAVSEWERGHFDAIVCDLAMPSVDGFQVMERILAGDGRERRPTAAVALTAYTSSELRSRVFAAGFQRHVVKPYDAATLIRSVAELLDPAADATVAAATKHG